MVTDITVLLDRSGSMSQCLSDVEGGFNTFLKEQKQLKETASISLYQFDTEYEKVYSGLDIQEVPNLKLIPRGMTALLDSINRVIVDARNSKILFPKRKHCPECGTHLNKKAQLEFHDAKRIIVIITDGMENSSHEVTKVQVFDEIDKAKKEGIDFVFLGADQDAIAEGHKGLGINYGSTMNYHNTPIGNANMFCSLSKSMTEYRTGSRTIDNFFDNEDREKCDEGEKKEKIKSKR